MTVSRAPDEPRVTDFEATIERAEGQRVVLLETYFYPEAGGQPADRGQLAGVPVTDVQERDGEVVHTLREPIDHETGDQVAGKIDSQHRRYCRRAHSASHVLYGAGRQIFDELGYGGFDISDEKIRVDLETSQTPADDELIELERLANRAVWASKPVSWEEVPVEEARADATVAFNVKTEEGVMAESDSVRIVTIEDWDRAACGGTHVANTADIGPIELLQRSNPGQGLTRFEFAVGHTAIDRRATIHHAVLDAAAAADSTVAELPDAIGRLSSDREKLQTEVSRLQSQLIEYHLDGLERITRDGHVWAVGQLDEMGPNDVTDALKQYVGDDGPQVAAVAGGDDAPFVAIASTGAVDADGVVNQITDQFGGGGGGSPTFAQGGGLDANPAAVVASLRSTDSE